MKLSGITTKQLSDAAKAVRRQVKECQDAAISGNRQEAYAAAERAQEAAFDLKCLFLLEEDEINPKG